MCRTRAALEALAPMLAVAGELERWGAAETKVAGITKTVYENPDSAVSRLLESNWRHGRAVVWSLYVAHTAALLLGIYAYYTMLAVLFSTFGSCSALFRALGAESGCAARRGAAAVAFLAGQHARLLDAARRARLLFADLFAHIVSALLTLPLLGTAELLVNIKDVDSLTLATFAVIATIFMPMCLAGQELEDSSAAVRERLYEGPWLQEDAATRRARAHFMLGAGCRARMAFGGLGSLNAASCLHVVNRWFSLLNVYINTNARHTAEPPPPL
ncbi:uncharacterized protein LOC127750691 [Frankliniella occidentalis]|uniref:Uncharacterized protein LOC127750691 n=1 Tax=Frankliniella occidentalis TaxID=133901 RepID=A0A9C6XS16_FRAOC|nr:uncharacterized protein LOC127750691 [Frankliniella occidentalis]